MNVAELIQSVAGIRRQRDHEQSVTYRELVRRLAAGEDVAPETVVETLDAVGKTEAELQADIEKREQRMKLADQVAKLPGINAELAQVNAQIEQTRLALEEAERLHRATVKPLCERRVELEQQITNCEWARNRLSETCDDSDLLARQKELSAERRQLFKQRAAIEQRLNPNENGMPAYALRAANSILAKDSKKQHPADRRAAEAVVEKCGAACAQLEAELATVRHQIAAIDRELDEVARLRTEV